MLLRVLQRRWPKCLNLQAILFCRAACFLLPFLSYLDFGSKKTKQNKAILLQFVSFCHVSSVDNARASVFLPHSQSPHFLLENDLLLLGEATAVVSLSCIMK